MTTTNTGTTEATMTQTTAEQRMFNPISYGFTWTKDGWYNWDPKAGRSAALRERNAYAKACAKAGRRVVKFSLRDQLVTVGGIGSGHPELSQVVTAFGVNVF